MREETAFAAANFEDALVAGFREKLAKFTALRRVEVGGFAVIEARGFVGPEFPEAVSSRGEGVSTADITDKREKKPNGEKQHDNGQRKPRPRAERSRDERKENREGKTR